MEAAGIFLRWPPKSLAMMWLRRAQLSVALSRQDVAAARSQYLKCYIADLMLMKLRKHS